MLVHLDVFGNDSYLCKLMRFLQTKAAGRIIDAGITSNLAPAKVRKYIARKYNKDYGITAVHVYEP